MDHKRLKPWGKVHLHKSGRSTGLDFQQLNLCPHLAIIRNAADPPVLAPGVFEKAALEPKPGLFETVRLSD